MANSIKEYQRNITVENEGEHWLLFREEQLYRPASVGILFGCWIFFVVVLFVPPIYKAYILGETNGDWFDSYIMYPILCFVGIGGALLTALLIGQTQLVTLVWTDHIEVSFLSPTSNPAVDAKRKKPIFTSDIESYSIRKYKPRLEYFGWGIRWGISGRAYTSTGRWGIQLVMKNGERFLIGTQRPTEFLAALDRLQNFSE